MNFYSSTPTSNSYTAAPKHHQRHHGTHESVTQRVPVMTSRETTTTTRPPFLLYPAPTKPTNIQGNSFYATTSTNTTAAAANHRVVPSPYSSTRTQRMASPDPSGIPPRTPPPSRFPRNHGGCIVSPPVPLRVTNSSYLNYQRIGPAHLQMYRLQLPLELQAQLDPIVAQAEAFSNRLPNGWHTDLYSLTKQDIALLDIPGMRHKVRPIFDYLCHAMRTLYGCQKVVVDKNQPHILKYSIDSGHTGVELHHDRCDVTANLALSRSGDYSGGGTYIPDTGSVVKLQHGECLLHPGSLVHGGMEVTRGTRYLMVTFAHLR